MENLKKMILIHRASLFRTMMDNENDLAPMPLRRLWEKRSALHMVGNALLFYKQVRHEAAFRCGQYTDVSQGL
jgi:hypothetical protein